MRSAILSVAAVAALSAVPVQAEPIMLDFTGKVHSESVMHMVGEADGVIDLTSKWETVSAPGTPLDGIAGTCFGTARLASGMMTGDGYCTYKDTAGETLFIRWWMDNAPGPLGAWQFAGGTGRWATAMGGGLFMDEPTEMEGVSTSHITGMLEFQ